MFPPTGKNVFAGLSAAQVRAMHSRWDAPKVIVVAWLALKSVASTPG
jgi:hypothetical protein